VEILISAKHERAHQRHWRDLAKWRLLFGLAVAPVLPIALGALLLILLESGIVLTSFGVVLAAAEIWSLPIGTLFLALARRHRFVRRAHCFLLGAFLAFSLPAAVMLTSKAVDWIDGAAPAEVDADDAIAFHGSSDGALVFLLGLVLVPFGTMGGWVFWRVGVYPAQPRALDVAAVFE